MSPSDQPAIPRNGLATASAHHVRKVVKAVCPLDCPDTCGMVVTIERGKAIDLRGDKDHPFTRGFLCRKMARYLDRVYSPQRLTQPLKRVGSKGESRFEPIGWDEALDTIAQAMREAISSPEGPQSILPYSYCGTMGKIQSSGLDRRFFHRIGASLLDRTICATAGTVGYQYTMGSPRHGADPLAVTGCRLILNWGSNTASTNSHLWSLMIQARKTQGALIVTIDPHRSETAARSDLHLPIRPGTDAALALGLAHVIFREGLEDRAFLEKAAHGVADFRTRALEEFPPERVAAITGLEVAAIEDLARRYAATHPSLIRLNYGLQRHRGGGMAVRTVACLPVLVGAWKYPGGGALLSTSNSFGWNDAALERPDLIPPGTRTVNMNQLAEALLGELPGPPVKVLYVYNSNPAAVAPDQSRVHRGLARDDLFTVVHDLFLTDTADFADLVLPATSQLEHHDIHGAYGHHFVMYNAPAIAPVGESKSNSEVFRLLAQRLGLESELFPDDETLIREVLNGGPALQGITLERLKETYSIRLNLPSPFVPFADGAFPTPSGKCELRSETMARDGYDSLPTYIPPREDPQTRPDLAARFPLQLITPPHPQFLNSTFANEEHHLKLAGPQVVELAAADAQTRGIADGDRVAVFNDRGQFEAFARVGDTVRPGVAVAFGIHWNKQVQGGRNVNFITSTALTDMGGGATFFDNLVEIRKLADNPGSEAGT